MRCENTQLWGLATQHFAEVLGSKHGTYHTILVYICSVSCPSLCYVQLSMDTSRYHKPTHASRSLDVVAIPPTPACQTPNTILRLHMYISIYTTRQHTYIYPPSYNEPHPWPVLLVTRRQRPLPRAQVPPGVRPLTHVPEGAAHARRGGERLGVEQRAGLRQHVRRQEAEDGRQRRESVLAAAAFCVRWIAGACARKRRWRGEGGGCGAAWKGTRLRWWRGRGLRDV